VGNNVDLCRMLNAPEKLDCQHCGASSTTHFDDYDIECGNPNPAPGYWRLRYYCDLCEHDSYWVRMLKPVPEVQQPDAGRLDTLAQALNQPLIFTQARHPITVEEGPNQVVFFRDADQHIFAMLPKDTYEDLLKWKGNST